MKQRLPAMLILLSGVLWGTTGTLVRALQAVGLGAMEITQIRMTGAALATALYLLLFRRDLLRIRLRDLWCFLCTGVLGLMLFSYFYNRNVQVSNLTTAAVLQSVVPAFLMLMSRIVFREKMTPRKLTALALVLAGCMLVAGLGTGQLQISALGLVIGLSSAFFGALNSVFTRITLDHGYFAPTVTFYSFLFCAIANAFFTDWGSIAGVIRADTSILPLMALLGIMTEALPCVCFCAGLKTVEPGRAAILSTSEPVVSTLCGFIFYHEAATVQNLGGMALVLTAIVLMNLQPKHKSEDTSNG
ncbi:MAG: EamA family transporter [Oscillospiraceae bacterium]|nr:EamA family transporter [Oscillospiraceae bacterium]